MCRVALQPGTWRQVSLDTISKGVGIIMTCCLSASASWLTVGGFCLVSCLQAVRAIGRCAVSLDKAAQRCIAVLLELIQTKVNYVVQEAVIVIKVGGPQPTLVARRSTQSAC